MAKPGKTVWIIHMNADDDGPSSTGVEGIASDINVAAELMAKRVAYHAGAGYEPEPSEGDILNELRKYNGDGEFDYNTGYGVLNVARYPLDEEL